MSDDGDDPIVETGEAVVTHVVAEAAEATALGLLDVLSIPGDAKLKEYVPTPEGEVMCGSPTTSEASASDAEPNNSCVDPSRGIGSGPDQNYTPAE